MDYVILGFLLLKSLSQYDIQQLLAKKPSPFYSSSLGSIQASLKKLERIGYITLSRTRENNRSKNLYAINSSGKDAFTDWFLDEINPQKFEAETSTKLFFLGLLPAGDRVLVVRKIIAFLEMSLDGFQEAEEFYRQVQVPPGFKDVAMYQLKTLDYGLYQVQQNLIWFNNLVNEMEESL